MVATGQENNGQGKKYSRSEISQSIVLSFLFREN